MRFLPDCSKRVYGLDVYRAIAIILVVLTHGSFMLSGTAFEEFPWIRLTDGVELFFVLSGFLIGSILIRIVAKNNYSLRIKDVLTFWKRRWFRTLPNYYLILIVNIIFVRFAVIDGDYTQFNYKFFLFLQNFSQPFVGFFWESWSLTIEEWFYIILPLSILMIMRVFPSKNGMLAVIIILIVFPLIYRIAQSGEVVDRFMWDIKFRKVVLMRLDTIIYGVLAAWVKHYYKDLWKRSAIPLFILGLILIVGIQYIPREPNDFFSKTFYFNIVTIGAMFLLPYADSVTKFKSPFGKIMTHISLISYSMYLINLALVVQVIQKNFPVTNPTDGSLKYLIYWAVVLLSSTLLYYFFERPVMDLRDKKVWTIKLRLKKINKRFF